MENNINIELDGIELALKILDDAVNDMLSSVTTLYNRDRISSEKSMDFISEIINLNKSIEELKLHNDDLRTLSSEKINEEKLEFVKQNLNKLFDNRDELSNEIFQSCKSE